MMQSPSIKFLIAGAVLLFGAIVLQVSSDFLQPVDQRNRSDKNVHQNGDLRDLRISGHASEEGAQQFEDLKDRDFSTLDFASPEGEVYYRRLIAWFRDAPQDAVRAALAQEDMHGMANVLLAGKAAFIRDPSLFREVSVALVPHELRFYHAQLLSAQDVDLLRSLLESSTDDQAAKESLLKVLPRERHYYEIGDMLAGIRGWSKEDASALVSETLADSPDTKIDVGVFAELSQLNLTQPAKDSLIAVIDGW